MSIIIDIINYAKFKTLTRNAVYKNFFTSITFISLLKNVFFKQFRNKSRSFWILI